MNLTPWRKKQNGSNELALSQPTDWFGEMDRLFEGFFGDPFTTPSGRHPALGSWAPSLDVRESEDAYTVLAEVPGVNAKDLDISVTGSVLSISGEKKHEKDQDAFRSERRYGSFHRSVELPEGVDAGKVTAELANGVLTLVIPKAETAKPKKIDVKVK